MKSKKLSILIFKIKFSLTRIVSSSLKRKIKKNSSFEQFKSLIKDKDFSTHWFLNNYKILGEFLPKDFNKKFNYLEIGSFEGLSALFVLFYWKNVKATFVDTWETSSDESQFLDFNFKNVEKKFDLNLSDFVFTKIKSTSTEAFTKFKNKLKFDYIYIDGSHNGLDIYNDAVASFNVLNEGGLIIFDDITNIYNEIEMQPHDAFEKFYNLYKKKIKVLYLKNIAIVKKTNF